MSGGTFGDLGSAIRSIRADIRARDRRCRRAVRKAARAAEVEVLRNIPRAFEELAHSVHVDDVAPGESHVIADAPHAASVEVGSRPHTPPIEPLIAWVTLRGMEGLTARGSVRRGAKDGNLAVATAIRGRMRAKDAGEWQRHISRLHGVSASAKTNFAGLEGADPAIVAIARAIQRTISKRGARPRRYMFSAIPAAEAALEDAVEEALPDR